MEPITYSRKAETVEVFRWDGSLTDAVQLIAYAMSKGYGAVLNTSGTGEVDLMVQHQDKGMVRLTKHIDLVWVGDKFQGWGSDHLHKNYDRLNPLPVVSEHEPGVWRQPKQSPYYVDEPHGKGNK